VCGRKIGHGNPHGWFGLGYRIRRAALDEVPANRSGTTMILILEVIP
jgi:hypothetical protein